MVDGWESEARPELSNPPNRSHQSLRPADHRQFGSLERALRGFEGLGEGQQFFVGLLLQVYGAAEALFYDVAGFVVQLNPVVLGVEEVDAAGDAVGHHIVDS